LEILHHVCRQIWRGKRKFYMITAKCHLREDDGQWKFWKPETMKSPHREYLASHPAQFIQLVEDIRDDKTGSDFEYFAAVDTKGEWDWSFRDKARIAFNTFHIDKSLIISQKPVKFSWKICGLDKYNLN
jgi:hypothetical protein